MTIMNAIKRRENGIPTTNPFKQYGIGSLCSRKYIQRYLIVNEMQSKLERIKINEIGIVDRIYCDLMQH